MKVSPFLPLFPFVPPLLRQAGRVWNATPAADLLRATALDLAVLSGHLVLYPAGIVQERRAEPLPPETAQLPTEGRAHPPVVLLHGLVDNRSVFVLLRRSLARHGWTRLVSLNYSPLTCDIRTAAESLAEYVEEICARTGHRQVDVIGHSLGGLIARYYVQRLGGDTRVRTLITIATPHEGTAVVPLANAHPVVRQMRPGSDLIEELRLPAPGCRTRFVSFWSDLDQLMAPALTARITHPDLLAENVLVSGVGHLAMTVHPGVAAGIRHALESPDHIGESGLDSVNSGLAPGESGEASTDESGDEPGDESGENGPRFDGPASAA
ncbi:triacylglycerol lipase [Streptomyces sp. 35G-GA-8]|uniref:esterase/lipase family protein n=1 Tax=Streptomyces sp. 35G-GA-8 TaxID=2939434 RepID=UPI00201F61DD|nr:alpha/beta fold hydrolase [Streptomyces sp. 35G-GA-8]MCL7376237.1 alpha/beta fold hydrolase [Streptomyces sp. 35G-GA-8]